MIRLVMFLGTMARTAYQPSRCSGETVGASSPGVWAVAACRCSSATS
ncbi:Uncharacterised protein [Mycobacteroides abscessus subsp. abscessus]|nr:Uncharacterised protein [Mycobacteroides abscessus subsp. abscessus]